MKKKKVCIVVASRANYGRIKSVLLAIKNHNDLELQLVVGASALLQKYGNVFEIIQNDGFEINAKVHYVVEGESPETMAKSTGLAIIELSTVFTNLNPDFVLTVADRYETMATAIAASYMNIPLVHTQGGEVTGSIDESVRHAISKLAHIHFPASEKSHERLIKMGENPNFIYTSGCPSIDAICNIDLSIDKLTTPNIGVGRKIIWSEKYLLVLQHPVTTEFGFGYSQIHETLSAIEKLDMQAVWLWPNVDAGSDDISKGLRAYREKNPNCKILFVRNFSVEDYARVLNNASCAIGNSSSFIREGSFLGTPSVIIGTRQNSREKGENVIEVNHDYNQIYDAVISQLNHGRYKSEKIFGDGSAGTKIANFLAKTNVSIQKVIQY
jgi:UDP-hydrolysing UDP-N-acetyl-D-glucosamine 2-epimerase